MLPAAELALVLLPPTKLQVLGGSVALEVSVHALSSDIRREVSTIFPDAPRSPTTTLLACVTFQFAEGGISLAPPAHAHTHTHDTPAAAAGGGAAGAGGGGNGTTVTDAHDANEAMDRMLERFVRFEAAVRAALQARGGGVARLWCDGVDPRSGRPLNGAAGAGRWSEVAGAHALLGYERRDGGLCPLVVHPLHGVLSVN